MKTKGHFLGEKMNWNDLLSGDRIRSYQKSTTSRDLRTEFEKDYHRIIGSASFRRLQDKTQVFPLDKSDFIRTRLTHSLEVSSFAKSLGQNVGEKIIRDNVDPSFSVQDKEDICAILQCAGLIHDIGNPPFGHFGETVIQDWFKNNLNKFEFKGKKVNQVISSQMKEDFYHFEGNTQALRVVSKLHFLVDENGMIYNNPDSNDWKENWYDKCIVQDGLGLLNTNKSIIGNHYKISCFFFGN